MIRDLATARQLLEHNNIDASTLELLIDNGFEQIYGLRVAGRECIAQWQRLRDLVEQTQCWPVLLGDRESLDMIRGSSEIDRYGPRTTKDIIEASMQIDAVQWLHEEYEGVFEDEDDSDEDDIRGEWPSDVAPENDFYVPHEKNLRSEPLRPEVYLALLPTPYGWQAHAYLRYGDWNYYPSPEEHVSVLHYWSERYGAEVVAITSDTLEMRVRRPPSDRAAALELAREQLAYCEDIVFQGMDTLDNLAATLLNGTVWFFWWD